MTMTLDEMLALLRDRVPPPGETGVQRISFAYGQVALSKGTLTPAEDAELRRLAEQAVCAKYEEEIAALREERDAMRTAYERDTGKPYWKAEWRG